MPDDEKDRFGDKLREVEKAREDKFFAERDERLLQKLKAQRSSQQERAELAHMRCPKCGDPLTTRTRHDVRLEECPSRHGFWLDAGELDKLVKRESSGWLSRMLGRPN